jgi:small-conductance mechanosensitive channel
MPLWHRAAVAGGVFLLASLLAKLVDSWLARRPFAPEAATRYRVLRRSVMTSIVVIGLLSALLVIPQVRAVAGGILASGAVLGVIVGFASQRTLGNFVAGLMIALTQPLRLGDRIELAGVGGVVEEISLTYTFIRLTDGSRLVVPNEKLASDTIRNATIRSAEKVAEVTLQVPLSIDLSSVVEQLHDVADDVVVRSLDGEATIVLRAHADDARAVERVASDLRLRAHERLRVSGVYA